MNGRWIRATYMRGGTSRALMFHQADLPSAAPPQDCAAWNEIFCAALGTPDPFGRQLDGMGGGISSLSKVAVIGPPTRPDADVDYTFAQVGVREAVVSYRGNCGNISSAVGPFAVDEGLVTTDGSNATVRIHNTNTGKIIVANFPLDNGKAAVTGNYVLPGVAGSGAPIRLEFLNPGGATTGRLLPTGRVRDNLATNAGEIETSLVDASNPVVFVEAQAINLRGNETVAELEANTSVLLLLEELRVAAAVAMGLATEVQARTTLKNLPLVSIVAPPRSESDANIVTRMISAGQPHRATPLTGAMCLSVAAHIPGTIVHKLLRPSTPSDGKMKISHASGTIEVAAKTSGHGAGIVPESAVVWRTARRLMDGKVYY